MSGRQHCGDELPLPPAKVQAYADTNGLPPSDGSAAAPFFDLAAKYCIAPGAPLEALLADCDCLLESGVGGFEEGGCEALTNAQWASLYALRQAKSVFAEIYRRVGAGECIEGRPA